MNETEARAARERAEAEGRVHGPYRCPRCGMRSNVRAEAEECCSGLGPSASERVPESRFERLE